MASTTLTETRSEPSLWRSIRWSNGAAAGLIVGLILFFVSKGNPWTGSGLIDPSVMGLEVAPGREATPGFFFGTMALHLALAAIYGVVISAIAHSFRPMVAGMVGGLIGLVLYFVDSAVFTAMFSNEVPQSELAAVVHHIAFGIITAEAYKGMARRRQPAPLM